ncbi:MAG TPA: proline/glycine betaine ABC transporter permease [Dehalococcoidia bacterium]|nr:proline/glycine betaine ABC transporter permease [Dehalococcoidia bacterium]
MFNPFDLYTIPLEAWVDVLIKGLTGNYRDFFQTIKVPVQLVLEGIQSFLLWLHPFAFLPLLFIIAWRIAGWRVAAFSLIAMAFVGFLGVWTQAMTTLAMVISAVAFCAAVGIPLGIIAARSNTFEASLRPVLDVMQTTPSFVYLVPVVMLFSIGTVSGVIATIIFALPPVVRLTNLGIRQVQREVVEAAYAFGSTPWQVLRDVQIPLALRTIMAGLNQTLMLALSMVVIAAIIGAKGLGDPVRSGLNNLQPGLASVGGIGIVLLAIILDRITQALGQTEASKGGGGLWTILQGMAGRVGLIRRSPAQVANAASSYREEDSPGSRGHMA